LYITIFQSSSLLQSKEMQLSQSKHGLRDIIMYRDRNIRSVYDELTLQMNVLILVFISFVLF